MIVPGFVMVIVSRSDVSGRRCFANSKIDDLDPVVLGNKYVVRLQVAM